MDETKPKAFHMNAALRPSSSRVAYKYCADDATIARSLPVRVRVRPGAFARSFPLERQAELRASRKRGSFAVSRSIADSRKPRPARSRRRARRPARDGFEREKNPRVRSRAFSHLALDRAHVLVDLAAAQLEHEGFTLWPAGATERRRGPVVVPSRDVSAEETGVDERVVFLGAYGGHGVRAGGARRRLGNWANEEFVSKLWLRADGQKSKAQCRARATRN